MVTVREQLDIARSVRQANVAAQQFVINWRSSGSNQVVGLQAASDTLRLPLKTLRCYLSTGKGKYQRTMINPITGEPDIVTIMRVPSAPKPKPRRGRPPKRQGRADPEFM